MDGKIRAGIEIRNRYGLFFSKSNLRIKGHPQPNMAVGETVYFMCLFKIRPECRVFTNLVNSISDPDIKMCTRRHERGIILLFGHLLYRKNSFTLILGETQTYDQDRAIGEISFEKLANYS